jgi:hypothetical protein
MKGSYWDFIDDFIGDRRDRSHAKRVPEPANEPNEDFILADSERQDLNLIEMSQSGKGSPVVRLLV